MTVLYRCLLLVTLTLISYVQSIAQCTSTTISAPTPQMGAMIAPQFVNLWRHVGVNDKHGEYFKNGSPSIGDDGWLCENATHNVRIYYFDIQPEIKKGDTIKVRFKGLASQVIRGVEDCDVQNIQTVGQYVTFEVKIQSGTNGNGFVFQLKDHCTDIEIARPGYELGDPRYLTDDYVRHIKSAGWKATRYMGLLAAPSNFGETWAKRVSPNAPININQWQWSAPDCNNLVPQFPKFSEDVVPFKRPDGRTDGMWSRGAPWETAIDISNYLNIDMWINIPTLADDDYVRNLAALIKQRLKPSLNVNVEIGNELWNFGAPFMGFYMLRQRLTEEWISKDPEKLKILGGKYCPGCNLSSSDTDNPSIDRAKCANDDYQAYQRWQARRLKEHAESFATAYGWRDEGGEVGTKIRMVLAGQFYGSNGMGWNIGPGIEFLQKAYGDNAPGKYLYAVALAPYIGPHANPDKETKEQFINMSIEDIERRANLNADSYFKEYGELWTTNPRPIYFGNLLEGVFAKARMFGLKMYAYEGGNELNTGGVNWGDGAEPKWENQKNADEYLSSPRAAALSKRFFDRWFSWFGYDALFMKNGDYQGSPMGGYSMSHTLNEDLPMRSEYARIANSPAIPLSKERGNLLSGEPLVYLDARKVANYNSDWENNAYGFPTMNYGTSVNSDYSFKSSNSMEKPFLIRCEKSGKYKFSIERSIVDGRIEADRLWPTYCDIYIDEKLVAKGVNLEADVFSRNIKYTVDNYDRVFWWTKDLVLDLPYGVHVLRVHPSAPTPERPGNDGYYGGNSKYNNKFDLARYRFQFESPSAPKKPKAVIGEGAAVCKSNSKALYEVSELDMGACEYVWSGLPSGAKILPLELVAGSNPTRYLSGQGTYKIYIDWGTVAVGEYTLQVLASNLAGSSEPLLFKVKVQTCGFEVNPSPVCKGEQTTFTPEPMAGVTRFLWDNGIDGATDRYTSRETATAFTYTYSKPGTYSVSLSTFDASGNPKDVYRNTVNVTACNEPVVASPVRYCKGAPPQPLTAILNSSARPATGLKWYTSAANGTGVTEITPSTATPGTNSYYVSQVYSTGAESDRAKIDVIVADAPAKPQIVGENPFVFCQTTSSSIEDLTNKVLWEAGATPRWYTTATGGTSTINPTIPSPGETNVKIYISAEKGTCESERAELVITKVSRGTDFLVEAKKPLSCGVDGEIIFIGLAPSQVYNVSYNALPEAEKTSTSNGRVILSLPAGTYKNFKVSQDGCVSVMNAPRTIENFGDGSAVGGVTRADTNVLAIGGKTIVRIRDHSGAIKWHVSKDGALFSEIPGAIKDTVGTGFLQAGTYSYKALLTSGSCNTPVSSTISVIKVGQPVNPVAGTITTSTPSVCAGSMAMLSLQGNTGDVQWQNSPEGTKFTNIEAATTATFTSPQLETSTWYRVKVTTTIGSVYSNKLEIKVNPSVLNGMSSSASNFSVSANQPKECGSLGSIVLKGLRLNTAFKVSYNDIVDEAKTSVGDSIVLPLPVGTYTNFKVSLNNCSKTVASSYDLKDPLAAPLEEQAGISTYCQDQEINISDLTNRVKSLPDAQLKWYKTTDGVPSDVPETPSTGDVGAKSVWVTQTINHCESDKLKLGIEVSPSANLITSKIDPSTCGLPDGKIEISSLANNIEYNIGYKKEGQAQTVKLMSDQFGKVVVNNLAAGNYSDVEVNPISGTSCFKISIDTLKLLAPGAPTLAPTVMGAGTYCEGGAIPALEATANSGGTLQWFSDIGLTNSVGTGTTMEVSPTKGNTTFYIVEVASECKSPMATVTSNVIAAPTPKVLVGSGGPASCKGTGYSLKLDESETDVRYTVFKDGLATNVALSGTGLGLIFPDQSEAGLYTIVGETEVGSCQENMTGQLTITKSIKPQVFITSGTIEGCEGTPGQNSVINLSGSEENTMYSLDPSNSNAKPGTGGPLTFTIEAKAVNNGSYVIIAINNQTGCDTIMNGEGIVNLKPGVGDPILSGADQYCNQTPSKVMLSVGNATEQSWSIAPDNAGSVDNTGNVTWKTTYSGSAKITVLVKNSACTEEGKQAEFTTKVFTTPDVSKISGDSLVCRGNIETYQVTAQPDIKYNWSIDANTNVEQDDQNGTMTLTYLEDLGAEGATLRVTPESKSCGLGNPAMMKIRKDNGCDLFVPNILTPNTSDNFNVWSIEGFNNFPNLNIEVFNRWGDRVYTYTGNYSKAWDGTQNGKPLPTATYYYVIDKKDGSAKVTGSVTIVRD